MVRRLIAGLAAALAAFVVVAPSADAAGDPLRARQWGLDMVEADGARATSTGEGAVVAVIDTGVDAAHEDLRGRLVAGHDFVDKDDTPQDGNGHGTHVTGIVAANANNGIGVASVAPGAKVMPVRVLDDNGEGTDADVAAGIDWAVAHGADVINLSLGGTALEAITPSEDFRAAIQRAVSAGVVVVAAAGNDSLPICEQPSIDGKMLCVGAVDRRRVRSFYSSGDSASIMAPGGSALPVGSDEDVLSTVPGSQYAEIAGSSQATPHVAGVAALLVSRGVRGQAAIDRILATASPAGPSLLYGAGIVNARAAVAGLPAAASGAAAGGGGSAEPKVVMARVQRIRTVLKRGLRARCSGACRVAVKRGGRTLLAGSGTNTVVARPTGMGRRLLRRGTPFTATATVVVDGGAERTIKLTFR